MKNFVQISSPELVAETFNGHIVRLQLVFRTQPMR